MCVYYIYRMYVYMTDGYYYFVVDYRGMLGWTHIAVNYIGPNSGEGVRMLVDGAEVASDTTRYGGSYLGGNGRISVGRYWTNRNKDYTSVIVDELIFFNRYLTSEEIKDIYQDWCWKKYNDLSTDFPRTILYIEIEKNKTFKRKKWNRFNSIYLS